MEIKDELEKKLIELKLDKRELVLAGKNTSSIDEKIKQVELKIKKYIDENVSNE